MRRPTTMPSFCSLFESDMERNAMLPLLVELPNPCAAYGFQQTRSPSSYCTSVMQPACVYTRRLLVRV
jgi:hypothetical protein